MPRRKFFKYLLPLGIRHSFPSWASERKFTSNDSLQPLEILQAVHNFLQEAGSRCAVDHAVIVGKAEVDAGSGGHHAVADHYLLDDGAYAQDQAFGSVENGSEIGNTEHTKVGDGDAGTDLGEVEGIFFEPLEEGSDKGRATINTVAEGSKPENNHGVTIEDTIYLRGKPIDLVIGDTVFKVYISGIKAVK